MYRQKHIELYSINTAYWSHTCIVWTSQLHSHNKDSGSMDSVLLLVITQVSWSSPYGSEHKLQGVFELPASEPFWPWSQLLCSMNHGAGLTQCFLTVSWAGAWFSVCVSTAVTVDSRSKISHHCCLWIRTGRTAMHWDKGTEGGDGTAGLSSPTWPPLSSAGLSAASFLSGLHSGLLAPFLRPPIILKWPWMCCWHDVEIQWLMGSLFLPLASFQILYSSLLFLLVDFWPPPFSDHLPTDLNRRLKAINKWCQATAIFDVLSTAGNSTFIMCCLCTHHSVQQRAQFRSTQHALPKLLIELTADNVRL